MQTLLQDIRYGARQLRRSPGFTLAAVLTVALGIGATVAIFSLVNAILLRPLPVSEPDRLFSITELRGEASPAGKFSYPHFRDYQQAAGEFADIAAEGPREFAFSSGDEAVVLFGSLVSENYFAVLGLQPSRGRLLRPNDADAAVVILNHQFWQSRFGGDPGVIGRTVRINSQPVEIVGVAPQGFEGTFRGIGAEFWVPLSMYPLLDPSAQAERKGRHVWLPAFGRLRPGVSEQQAMAALSTVATRLEPEIEGRPATGVRLEALTGVPANLRSALFGFLSLLFVSAVLVLVIASVNVAGMLLARAAGRQREVAVRLAIGAGRGRIVRQLLTESVLLFVLGATGGVLFAYGITHMLGSMQLPLPVRISLGLAPDARVLLFALALALTTGVVFGLAPAFAASRASLATVLKAGARGQTAARTRLRSAFVIGQVAFSLLLLIAAGLFVRALIEAASREPGFDPDGVTVASVDLEPHGYDRERGGEFLRELTGRVTALPGVESVGLARSVPLSLSEHNTMVRIEGHEPAEGESGTTVDMNTVDAGYFETLQIPLVRGRGFTTADREGAPPVVVVNQAFVERFWPGEEPLGKRISRGSHEMTVVGVTRTGRYNTLDEADLPYMYLPFGQDFEPAMTLHVRSRGESAALLARRASRAPVARPECTDQRTDAAHADGRGVAAPAAAGSGSDRRLRCGRPAARRDRRLRDHRLLRRPADARDRHPHRTGRPRDRGTKHDRRAGRPPGGARPAARSDWSLRCHAFARQPAIRNSPGRPAYLRSRGTVARYSRVARVGYSRQTRDACRPRGRAAGGVAQANDHRHRSTRSRRWRRSRRPAQRQPTVLSSAGAA